MAENYLITGYWGEPHVTAENDRGINASIFGAGKFVLGTGEMFRAEYIGNNTIRMYDGKLMNNGAAAGITAGEYVDLTISNAAQGMKRTDLIVFQYEKDKTTLVESGKFVVIQGAETASSPKEPTLRTSDLLTNTATFDQMALWSVSISGTAISIQKKLFSTRAVASHEALQELNTTVNRHGENLSNINQYGLYRRILTSADDLDNILEAGVYAYETASVPKNAPFASAAVVEVIGTTSNTRQKIQRAYRYGEPGNSAFRPFHASMWLKWSKCTTVYLLDLNSDTREITFKGDNTAAQLYSDLENNNPVIVATEGSGLIRWIFHPVCKMPTGYIFVSDLIGEDEGKYWFEVSAAGISKMQISSIADTVIESGTENNWQYRKWASGRIELWGVRYMLVTIAQELSTPSGFKQVIAMTNIPSFVPENAIVTVTPKDWFIIGANANINTDEGKLFVNLYGKQVDMTDINADSQLTVSCYINCNS